MTLGARVRQCRLALSWSQADLANRIGVKQQSIDQLESGKVSRPRYIVELAESLNV
ncbi:MAG: helix-turn-helix transcriptional regulator, partial [Rhodospirillaceae bacterium]|nr:helix-turn-helix transcriptional regulator [Rhodospirillaceae bacterium]